MFFFGFFGEFLEGVLLGFLEFFCSLGFESLCLILMSSSPEGMVRVDFPPPHVPAKNELSVEGFLAAVAEARLTAEEVPRSCSS